MTFPRSNSPVIGIVSGIAVVLLFVIVSLSFNLSKTQKNYHRELSEKMTVEETVNKLNQQVVSLTADRSELEKQNATQKYSIEALTKELVEVKRAYESLKEESVKVGKLKEQLEKDLKEALYHKK